MSPGCVPGAEWRPMECTACHFSGWRGRSTVTAMFYILASFSHPHRLCLTHVYGDRHPSVLSVSHCGFGLHFPDNRVDSGHVFISDWLLCVFPGGM